MLDFIKNRWDLFIFYVTSNAQSLRIFKKRANLSGIVGIFHGISIILFAGVFGRILDYPCESFNVPLFIIGIIFSLSFPIDIRMRMVWKKHPLIYYSKKYIEKAVKNYSE